MPGKDKMFYAGYASLIKLREDFDIQVDYEVINWPMSNGVSISLGIWFDQYQVKFERVSLGPTNYMPGTPREIYWAFLGNEIPETAKTDDHAGTLRLVRTGNKLTAYYLGPSGWVNIYSKIITTSDVQFWIYAWSADWTFSGREVKIAFDNFIINSGQLLFPPSIPPITFQPVPISQDIAPRTLSAPYKSPLPEILGLDEAIPSPSKFSKQIHWLWGGLGMLLAGIIAFYILYLKRRELTAKRAKIDQERQAIEKMLARVNAWKKEDYKVEYAEKRLLEYLKSLENK